MQNKNIIDSAKMKMQKRKRERERERESYFFSKIFMQINQNVYILVVI